MTKKSKLSLDKPTDPHKKVHSVYMGNLLILEYMQIKETMSICTDCHYAGSNTPIYSVHFADYRGSNSYTPGAALGEFKQNVQFHYSWNWLMAVWGKILLEEKEVRGIFSIMESVTYRQQIIDGMRFCNLHETYQAIVRYIVWFKEDKAYMKKYHESQNSK